MDILVVQVINKDGKLRWIPVGEVDKDDYEGLKKAVKEELARRKGPSTK